MYYLLDQSLVTSSTGVYEMKNRDETREAPYIIVNVGEVENIAR